MEVRTWWLRQKLQIGRAGKLQSSTIFGRFHGDSSYAPGRPSLERACVSDEEVNTQDIIDPHDVAVH